MIKGEVYQVKKQRLDGTGRYMILTARYLGATESKTLVFKYINNSTCNSSYGVYYGHIKEHDRAIENYYWEKNEIIPFGCLFFSAIPSEVMDDEFKFLVLALEQEIK